MCLRIRWAISCVTTSDSLGTRGVATYFTLRIPLVGRL